jgi:hypothetical protein
MVSPYFDIGLERRDYSHWTFFNDFLHTASSLSWQFLDKRFT